MCIGLKGGTIAEAKFINKITNFAIIQGVLDCGFFGSLVLLHIFDLLNICEVGQRPDAGDIQGEIYARSKGKEISYF